MKELFLEIGTEEIPAGFIPQALTALESLATKEFEAQRIEFKEMRTLGTPRRLVLVIGAVSEQQRTLESRKVGPSKQAGFDSRGNPSKAAVGFARSQGVPIESLKVIDTEKGEYLCAVKEETGQPTFDLLPSILCKLILSIPFQKSMRWADVGIRFARPIHWIVALFGGKVVPFEVGIVRSGKETFGHRFMSPGAVSVSDFGDYLQKTRERFVLVDPAERRKKIEDEMVREASKVSGTLLRDDGLLEEVVFLVEYPVALRGTFDPQFLSLPREVLTHSMKEHQRYFPVVDGKGTLLPHFLCVSNIAAKDQEVVIKGNEKVLRARLSDAAYFLQEDLKVPLEKRVEELKKVVFQAKLGTSYEKMDRFRALADFIAKRIDPKLRPAVERTAFLCKADLVTGMVGEFPKLQGIVGREYAKRLGEAPEVAEAIHEHYLPAFAGDRLPASPIGDLVSMADRLDTIVGCFSVGLVPTGTADPFGLRRHALAILRIIVEKKYSLSLPALVEESQRLFRGKRERAASDVTTEVLDFFRVRYQNLLLDRGYSYDVIDAALSVSFGDLLDAQSRIDALAQAKTWKDFESIVIASKRAINILKGASPPDNVDPGRFLEPAEKALHQAFLGMKEKLDRYLETRDYQAALLEMTHLKKPVDDFFDQVMVMVEDSAVRDNRLALLDQIGRAFLKVADFSRLA